MKGKNDTAKAAYVEQLERSLKVADNKIAEYEGQIFDLKQANRKLMSQLQKLTKGKHQ